MVSATVNDNSIRANALSSKSVALTAQDERAFCMRPSENEEMDSVKVTGKKTTCRAYQSASKVDCCERLRNQGLSTFNGEGANLRNSLE